MLPPPQRYAELVNLPPALHSAGLELELRAICANDWELAKSVRLAALADAPDTFERTLDEELQLSDELWRQRARETSTARARYGLIALCAGVPCGFTLAVLDAARLRVILNGMWVAPNARRRGIGRALMHAVCDWAKALGATVMDLEVITSASVARTFYSSLNFVESANSHTSFGPRRIAALRMERKLV